MQKVLYYILIIKGAFIRWGVLKKGNSFEVLLYARYGYQTSQHYVIT